MVYYCGSSQLAKEAHVLQEAILGTYRKCRTKLRVPWKPPHQELQNELPLYIPVCTTISKILMYPINEPYSNNLDLGLKDFEVFLEVCYVRARFKALDVLVFHGGLSFALRFFSPRLASRTMCAALAT